MAGMVTAARREPALRARRWGAAVPYLFISPFFLVFAAFSLFPMVFSLGVSLMDWQGVRAGGFTGIANYVRLFRDPVFWQALLNTVIVWLGTVPPMILLALVLAVTLESRAVKARSLFRTVYYLPVVTSLVITGLVFDMLFSTSYGLANNVLARFGVSPINWLTDPPLMRTILMLAILWRWTGNDMVIMLAGLNSIPKELYEAARVDGAGAARIFFTVTVPLMIPVILFDAVVSTIGTFNLFEEPYALFGRGQLTGVNMFVPLTGTYLYQNAFVFAKFGFGSAIAWVVAVIIFALSILQFRVGGREGRKRHGR
jgi:lactose/L-arabinose transport system permease protein